MIVAIGLAAALLGASGAVSHDHGRTRYRSSAIADGVRRSQPRPGVNVLAVDPTRRMGVITGNDGVPGLETVASMAARHGAIAGVNGGFFAVHAPDAGDPTGVVVAGGTVLSEPVGARTALFLPKDGPARIGPLRWKGTLTVGGATRLLDGVDRNRGRIPACGGVGGDRPTEAIDIATTCADPSELVMLTPEFGARTRTTGGVEATVSGGVVTAVRRGGNAAIPRDGYVLSGSGDAARFLRRHARTGTEPVLAPDYSGYNAVLGGAPRLVRDGRVDVGDEARAADTRKGPRTVVGVRADGTVLLITLDGATPQQAARAARRAGAEDALSLDSGSSTTMVVGDRVVAGGQRPVADGLFVLP